MFYLLLLIIATPSFISLLNPWYFSMHDGSHVVRLFLLEQAVRQGYFYPRWVDVFGFGFGYPLFNFYPPLIYYVSEGFRLLGASYIWSIKAMIIFGYIVGAIGMYRLSYKVIKSKVSGLVAATLFTFFSYHATLVYARGALAEFWGMNVLPFAFYSMELLRERPTIKRAIFFGVTLALLILSHILVALPFVLFFILYTAYSILNTKNKARPILFTFLGGVIGASLSAFYWLPAMFERKFTLVKSLSVSELFDYKLHFVDPFQFWFSQWGFGGSVTGLGDGLSFQLGKIHIGLAVLSFILFLFLAMKKRIDTLYVIRYTVYATMLLISLFMTTEYSKFIWESVPLLQYLQFPWRLLTFTGLFISMLGGSAVYFIQELLSSSRLRGSMSDKIILLISLIIISGTIFQYQKYFKPESYVKKTDKELTSFEEVAWNMSERAFDFIPEGVPLKKTQYGSSVVDIGKKQVSSIKYQVSMKYAEVSQAKNNFNEKAFSINSPKPFVFTLNTFNFPGWTAHIDGGRLPISDNNKYKLITVRVPSGVHNLEFRFEDTPVRKWSNIVSFMSLIGATLLLGVGKFKKSKG